MRGQSETPGQGLQNGGRVLPPDPPWAQGRRSLGWEQGVLWAVGWEVAWSRYWLRVWGASFRVPGALVTWTRPPWNSDSR